MPNIYQNLRTAVTGRAPPAAAHQPGELWVNFPDMQMGLIDAAQNPQKLVAVRYFSATAAYASGEFVVQAGALWVAKASVPAGAFVPAQWNQLATYTGGTFQSLIVNGPAGTARSILGQTTNVNRWELQVGGITTESGSNAGSNFNLIAYNDAGAVLGTPMSVNRGTGEITHNAIGATLAATYGGTAGDVQFALNKAASGNAATIWGRKSGLARWAMSLGDPNAEGGSNAGSDFALTRFADNGTTAIDNVFTIVRGTAAAHFTGAMTVDGVMNCGGNLNVGSTAAVGSLVCAGASSVSTLAVNNGLVTIGKGTATNPVVFFNDGSTNRVSFYFNISTGESTWTDNYSGSNIRMGPSAVMNISAGSTINLAATTTNTTGALAAAGSISTNGNCTVAGAINIQGTNGTLKATGGAPNPIWQLLNNAGASVSQWYYNASNGVAYVTCPPQGSNIAFGADITIGPAGGHNLIVTPGQGYQAGGGAWAALSDARIKTVQGEYSSGLEAILKLRPVVYTYNGNDTMTEDLVKPNPNDPEEKMAEHTGPAPYPNSMHYEAAKTSKEFVGLIAQEVETVMPEMVTQAEGWIDGVQVPDMRHLDGSALVYALVNAVKELSAKVTSLEAQLAGK